MTTDRFCRSCGASIALDTRFCESCGKPADAGAAASPPIDVARPRFAAPGRLPVIAGAAVVMAVVVGGVIWWTGRDGSDGALGQSGRPPAATAAPATATAGARSPVPATVAPPLASATPQSTPSPAATPRTATPGRTSTPSAADLRPLLGDWDIRSAVVTENGETKDATADLADTFIRILTRNNGGTLVLEMWMPYTESFELTEVTLRQTSAGRYEGTGEGDDGTDLIVTARLPDGSNRLELTFVDADPLADPPNRLVLGLARRAAGGSPTPAPTSAALDLRRPETYLPAAGRHFSYVETYTDGSGSNEPEAITAQIPGGPAVTRLELTPDAYAGMLTIAMHYVIRSDGVYLAYDPFPTELTLWLARDLAAGRRWETPGSFNGPSAIRALVVETGGACPNKKVKLSNCMTLRVEYVDAGFTFLQWYAPGYGEVMRRDAANLSVMMELVAVEEIGESTALAVVRSEAPNVAKVPR